MANEDGTIEINGKRYDIVTLDFETFYDKDYTLSGKINMSEYIRDARFHVHGVGIKKGTGETLWYTKENIPLALAEIDWSKTALLGQNTAFDGFIVTQIYGHMPAFFLDTLGMSRASRGHHVRHDLDSIAKSFGLLGKRKRSALADTKGKRQLSDQEERALGGYCVDDVNDTYASFWRMFDHIPDKELQLIDLTLRMFCDPVLLVDIPRVQAELEKEVGGKMAALLKSGATVEDLMSNQKFEALLRKAGLAYVPSKMSPSTGKMTHAFAKSDVEFQKLLSHPNQQIADLAAARLKIKSTIGETRAVRFLEAGKDGMPLPILLNYSGAHTHRWSGGNKMNLQNLVRGGELRKSILAPPGYSVVVADSAQIEARVLAWLAKQDDILEAFAKKRDLYSEFATLVYGRTITKADKIERHLGKVCILGLGYGMGHKKLRATLASGALGGPPIEMSEAQCKTIVNLYRSRNNKIRLLWKDMDNIIAAMMAGFHGQLGPIDYGKNYIRLPSGLFLQYYGLHGVAEERYDDLVVSEAKYLTKQGMSKIYGGLLTENVVQALARCIVADQMLAIASRYRVVTMTHDEIVVICPTAEADKCLADMIKIMSTPPEWAKGLPLAAEGGHDVCYSK